MNLADFSHYLLHNIRKSSVFLFFTIFQSFFGGILLRTKMKNQENFFFSFQRLGHWPIVQSLTSVTYSLISTAFNNAVETANQAL